MKTAKILAVSLALVMVLMIVPFSASAELKYADGEDTKITKVQATAVDSTRIKVEWSQARFEMKQWEVRGQTEATDSYGGAWESVGAEENILYILYPGDKNYTKLTTVKYDYAEYGQGCVYTVSGLKPNTKYAFKVVPHFMSLPVFGDNDSIVEHPRDFGVGSPSAKAVAQTYGNDLAAPVIGNIKVADTNKSVTISWSKVKGAEKYALYVLYPGKKDYTRVTTTASTSYTIKTEERKTYKFEVRSVDVTNGKATAGVPSEAKEVFTFTGKIG